MLLETFLEILLELACVTFPTEGQLLGLGKIALGIGL